MNIFKKTGFLVLILLTFTISSFIINSKELKALDNTNRWTLDADNYYNYNWISTYTIQEADYSNYTFQYFKTGEGWKNFSPNNNSKIRLEQLSGENSITRRIYHNDQLLVEGIQGLYGETIVINFRYKIDYFAIDEWRLESDGYYYYNRGFESPSTTPINIPNHVDQIVEYRIRDVNVPANTTNWANIVLDASDSLIVVSQGQGYAVSNNLRVVKGSNETTLATAVVGLMPDETTKYEILQIRYRGYLGEVRPGINGNEHFVTEVDNIRPVSFFVDQLVAFDLYDGDISHLIQIQTDNFTGKTALGQYRVDVYVIDTSNNRSDFTFYVHIIDNTAPTVSGDFSTKTISYDRTFDLSAFLNSLTVTDNYYPRNQIEVKITKDNYTYNKLVLGTYLVEIEVSDPSLNSNKIQMYIKVADLVKPVFSGITSYSKPFNKIVTVTDIIKDVTAHDFIDGDLTAGIQIVQNTFSGNSNVVGNYKIVLAATDAATNQALHTINVEVYDEDGADWYVVDGTSINLEEGSTMTRAQIIALLAKIDLIEISSNSIVTYSVDTYSNNIGEPGVYRLAFNVTNPDGTSNDYEYTVNVGDVNTDDADVLPGDEDSFLFRNSAVIVIVLITIAAGSIIYLKISKK